MKFIRNMYVKFVQWITTCLAFALAGFMKHLIILQGKDPNYIVPSPLPELKSPWADYDPARAQQTINKFTTSRLSYAKIGSSNWVKNSSEHPVIKARHQFEEKRASDIGLEIQPPELSSQEAVELLNSVPVNTAQEEWLQFVKIVADNSSGE